MNFELNTRLEADTHFVADLALCRVLLMDNAALPWLILVPRVAGAVEFSDLEGSQRAAVWEEMSQVHDLLETRFSPDKMNTGAIGNLVSQLHVHIVARFKTDAAWPAPVWGNMPAAPYDGPALEARLAMLREALALN